MPEKIKLQELMLQEADIILASIDFLEELISSKLEFFEKAISENKFEVAEFTKIEIETLLKKLSKEEKNMDDYMTKFRKLIQYEKEKMLYDIKQKK